MKAQLFLVLGLAALSLGGGCNRSSSEKKERGSIDHRAGIPIIPRGKVVASTSKGERFLLEIEARMPLSQAVTYYRRRLPMDGWTDLRIQKVAEGLWGISARRGMFQLTGRIKGSPKGVVSIGFERRVRKAAPPLVPPVPEDVPTLEGKITWRGPIFEAPGGRAEIRGSARAQAGALRKALLAALRRKGWTALGGGAASTIEAKKHLSKTLDADAAKAEARRLQGRGWTARVLSDGKTVDAQRRLTYHVDELGDTSRVRMILAYAELAPDRRRRPSPGTSPATRPSPRARPAVSANVVALPRDLVLWPAKEPVLGVKRSETVWSFGLDRRCSSPRQLLGEIRKILLGRGYASPAKASPASPSAGGRSVSATLLKGKRAVVVIVSQQVEGCSVELTVVRAAR